MEEDILKDLKSIKQRDWNKRRVTSGGFFVKVKTHSSRIGYDNDGKLNFGILNSYMRGVKYSVHTKKYNNLYHKLMDYGKSLFPNLKFNCIQVNKNCKSKKHKDAGNHKQTGIMTIGDFEGGGIIVYDTIDENKVIKIVKKNEPYKFDACNHYHETEDFDGERYTFIFYETMYYDLQQKWDEYVICIPSHHRSIQLQEKTLSFLHKHNIDKDKILIFVDKTEYDTYKKTIDKEYYKYIFKGDKGLLNQKEVIFQQFPPNHKILMLDDDIEDIDFTMSVDYKNFTLHELILEGFSLAQQSKSNVWSVNTYNKFNRISKKNEITYRLTLMIGGFCGYINQPNIRELKPSLCREYNDEKEDVERSILYFIKYGKTCRFNKIGYKTKYYNDGGLGTYEKRKISSKGIIDALLENYSKYVYLNTKKSIPDVILKNLKLTLF